MSVDNKIHNTYMAARKSIAKMVSRLVPPKEVEDILQETYVRMCQVQQPTEIREPKSFLYRTAKNLALDHLKRADVRLVDSFDDEEQCFKHEWDKTYHQAASSEEFGQFCDAVRRLPVQCRRAFVLKKVYGYSQKEIAKELQISESTVEKHIAEGIKRCTQYMMQLKSGSALGSLTGQRQGMGGGL